MERLSSQDWITLWPEALGWPQDIGALGVLDGDGLFDDAGHFRLELARELILQRIAVVPRFRQVLHEPGPGLGRPLWVDDPGFDISRHVRAAVVRATGQDADLVAEVQRLRRDPLDRTQPLWQVWFLIGLTGDRVGLLVRAHHVIADGPVGVAMLTGLLDGGRPRGQPAETRTPVPLPSKSALLLDNLRRSHPGTPAEALPGAGRKQWPASLWRTMRSIVAATPAPVSSVNVRIGGECRLTLLRSRLDLFADIAHANDATVNDVLLTVVAGGLRELLSARGERVDGVVLRAFVPVSLHEESDAGDQGNRLGMLIAPLPIGIRDPRERLRRIGADTATQKALGNAQAGAAFRDHPPPRFTVRFMAHQRSANTQVSNIPGPSRPLSFAGSRLLEIFPIVPLMGNLTLLVGAMSYAGQFNITVSSDLHACPDVDVFVAGLGSVIDALDTQARRSDDLA